ncbi:hypothetical protein D3C76_1623920 [compost metagenome]
MFEQVRQFFIGATEIIQAYPDHQPDRHVPALGAGLEQHLQTVAQGIALDLEAIQGKRRE